MAFFAVCSTTIFVFNVLHRVRSTLLELLALLLNAGAFFVASDWVVSPRFGRRWIAAVSLGLAAFYASHVWYFLARRSNDRGLLVGFMGLAVFFLSITVPLVLSQVDHGLLGNRALRDAPDCGDAPKRVPAAARLRPLHGGPRPVPLPRSSRSVLDVFRSRYAARRLSAVGRASCHVRRSGRLDGRRHYQLRTTVSPARLVVDNANDVREWVRERWAVQFAVVLALGMAFLFLNLELDRSLRYLFPPVRLPVLTLLWLGACGLLSEYLTHPRHVALAALTAFVFGLLVKLWLFDLDSWDLGGSLVYGGPYSPLDAALRFVDFGVVVAFFASHSNASPAEKTHSGWQSRPGLSP